MDSIYSSVESRHAPGGAITIYHQVTPTGLCRPRLRGGGGGGGVGWGGFQGWIQPQSGASSLSCPYQIPNLDRNIINTQNVSSGFCMVYFLYWCFWCCGPFPCMATCVLRWSKDSCHPVPTGHQLPASNP